MASAKDIENEVKAVVADQLDKRAIVFEENNLLPGEVSLSVSNELEDQRESEIRLYFYRGKNIVDALEFHVYKKGKLVSRVDEITEWIGTALSDIVRRAAGAEFR